MVEQASGADGKASGLGCRPIEGIRNPPPALSKRGRIIVRFLDMNIADFHFSEGPGNQMVILYQGREIATARSFPEACSLVLDAVSEGHLPQDRAESRT
jgi:hypothetical protein